MAPFDPQFLSTFLRRQNFDLPDSIIYYILKNPKSSKVYQKLIKTCKYFFIKNPILVIHCLQIDDDGWKICSNQTDCDENDFHQTIDSRIISSCRKLWIQQSILIYSTDSNAATDLISKFFQSDAKVMFFKNQKMSLQQFLFYARNSEYCILSKVIVSSDIGAEIPLEEIVANLPNVLAMSIKYGHDSRNASSDTAKKLLQIPHFKNLTQLDVIHASEEYDIDLIYDYYKKNRSRFTFAVTYQSGLSQGCAKKLDGYVREILDFKFYDNTAPMIEYPEQNIYDVIDLMELRKMSL